MAVNAVNVADVVRRERHKCALDIADVANHNG
jgi:hypothetical protein